MKDSRRENHEREREREKEGTNILEMIIEYVQKQNINRICIKKIKLYIY